MRCCKGVKSFGWVMVCCIMLNAAAVGAQDIALQRVEIASSPNPVTSGGRALGMGGAYIAVADDVSACSINPAGLAYIPAGFQFAITGAMFSRDEDLKFDGENVTSTGSQKVGDANLNYLGIAYSFGKDLPINMTLAFAYQHLYDFNRKWELSLSEKPDELMTELDRDIDAVQEGDLGAWGAAISVFVKKINLALGVTCNLWGDGTYNEWQQTASTIGVGTLEKTLFSYRTVTETEYTDFSGINFNVGALWIVESIFGDKDCLTIGGVFKSGFDADIDYKRRTYSPGFIPITVEEERSLTMPMSYGVGIAYRFNETKAPVLITADFYRTHWDDYVMENGGSVSPINGKSESDSDVKPTNHYRMGIQYKFEEIEGYEVCLRGGFFYDPAPAEGETDKFYGVTLGAGLGVKKVMVDIAYQYRCGNDVGTSILQEYSFSEDVKEHTIYLSLQYAY